MSDPTRTPDRRTVLKKSALLGAGILGSSGVTTARRPSNVGGVIQREPSNPITEADIRKLHAEVRSEFARKFGGSVKLPIHPVDSGNQTMVAYGITVDETGQSERYQGLVSESSTRAGAATTASGTDDTRQRHAAAEEFVANGGRSSNRIGTQAVSNEEGFSEWGKVTNEFGDCDGGKVVMTSTAYLSDDNSDVWALGSTTQIIPGTNTTCETDGLNDSGRAEHRWDNSSAVDPVIISRAPTGTKDGTKTGSASISVSIGTDTSGSGTVGGSYTQPDVYFSSKGSTVSTELNWSYNDSSADITWQTDYLSMCDMRENLEYRDLIVEDYYDAKFLLGPDATFGQYFQNVPGGGV